MACAIRPAPAWLAVAAVVVALAPVAAEAPDDDLLRRARASWTAFEAALGSVLAEEDYRQQAWWPTTPPAWPLVRRTRAELLLFQVPGSAEWVTFRQIAEVDGQPPVEPSPSIAATLADTSQPLNARIGTLVRASASHNLGDIVRTINTPTFAPIVLRPEHARRVRFQRAGDADVDGVRAAVVRFTETERPTIVRGVGTRNVPMRGRLWLDPATGRVLRSTLTMRDRDLTATIDVDYGLDPGLGMLVPQMMRERYGRRRHVVTTEARYTRYRRFTTSARIIGE